MSLANRTHLDEIAKIVGNLMDCARRLKATNPNVIAENEFSRIKFMKE